MRWHRLAFLAFLATAPVSAAAAASGPYVNPSNSHTYYVTEDQLTWSAAEAWAASLGGHLVAVNDAPENAWLTGTLPLGGAFYWIGGREDANTTDMVFEWVTGEPWLFTNFEPGEPDDNAGLGGSGDYLAMNGLSGTWFDMDGSGYFTGAIAELPGQLDAGRGTGGAADVRLSVQTVAASDAVRLRLEMPRAAVATLLVHDVSGRIVRTLAEGTLAAGTRELRWDARDDGARRVASGIYFVSLRTEGIRRSCRVVLTR